MRHAENRTRARSAVIAAALFVAIALMPLAQADHIRVMVVSQSGANGLSVTIRVDFQYSGNCCGGAFNFWPDNGAGRFGTIPDGISGGAYQGDAAGTKSFSNPGTNPPTFTWTRTRPDPTLQLVRIEITYSYAAAGSYTVAWNDCCPASSGAHPIVVATGIVTPPPPHKVLAIQQIGNTNLQTSFAQAAIPPCSSALPGPLCHELVLPATFALMTQAQLNSYDVILVGSNADAVTIAALNTVATAGRLINFVLAGGSIIGYAQWATVDPWKWVPNLGAPTNGLASVGDSVYVTEHPPVLPHSVHLNQVYNPATGSSTLSGWDKSHRNVFLSYPSYLEPVARTSAPPLPGGTATGQIVSLAGKAGTTTEGCVYITGQPVDERAVAGINAARELFRSSINYAITCPP